MYVNSVVREVGSQHATISFSCPMALRKTSLLNALKDAEGR